MLCESIFAQRLLKGQIGFEGVIGVVSDKRPIHDYFIETGLTVNGKNGSYTFWNLEYARKNHGFETYSIPVERFTAEGGYSLPILRDWGKNISLNAGFSGVIGYEVFNHSEPLLPNGAVIQNADSFIYGVGLRLTIETYLSDHLLFIVQGKTRGIWGTSVEHFRPSAGLGLRYIF
ncbi:conjugal transfer protein TraO [Chryseobacterium sp. SL1]|uniref:conjugal transfer protein TraO n=1 Tax=Chryseobacterium sp. SL1 TaxID=2995159 RepID=UPI002272F619|nr:conjugal transfer protein TraO [Chryseobacterium sp. SL1]MCY1662612.1 conjugal transfer protein TraO [Chryseobacterium sp. SL1]